MPEFPECFDLGCPPTQSIRPPDRAKCAAESACAYCRSRWLPAMCLRLRLKIFSCPCAQRFFQSAMEVLCRPVPKLPESSCDLEIFFLEISLLRKTTQIAACLRHARPLTLPFHRLPGPGCPQSRAIRLARSSQDAVSDAVAFRPLGVCHSIRLRAVLHAPRGRSCRNWL